ncbi:MAG: hypothetical protein ABIJ25_07790 [Pseudomonadota bacterium]
MIQRYSSRRSPLKDFLATQLQGACRYDRIAGFLSSSLLEVAGEALERMTTESGETCVRMVCNSCLNPLDVQTARAAKWGMHREWCASLPAEIGAPMKARLRRIGQLRPEVLIYNMRYRGSVEDRVHQLLSERLVNIRNMFGQIPDTLEDVWVAAALRDEEEAKRVIDAVPKRHPFEMRYDRIESVDWESCSRVLDSASQLEALREGW